MARLTYIRPGSDQEESLVFSPDGDPISIGRQDSVTLRFANSSVSRHHCLIWFLDGQFTVKDQGSANGTRVNDKKIVGPTPLASGDRIQCGEISLTFFEENSNGSGGARAAAKSPAKRSADAFSKDRPAARTSTKTPKSAGPATRTRVNKASASEASIPQSVVSGSAQALDTGSRSGPNRSRTASRMNAAAQAAAAGKGASGGDAVRLQSELGDLAKKLRKVERERDKLRDGMAASGRGRERELVARIKELEQERDDYQHLHQQEQALNAEQAAQIKELDEKSVRLSMQFESVTDKYRQVREELDRLRLRLEDARDTATEKEDQVDSLSRGSKMLEEEVRALRLAVSDGDGKVRELKIRLTEKDRQIDQLHDQLAETEYELNEARTEVKQLQAEFNRDSGEASRSEQRANLLREIIEDKENIIAQLRRDLEEKDREIKQVRMGVGLVDLEEERRKVLDDFYKKTREVDELTDQVAQARREKEEVQATVAELQAKLDEADEHLVERLENHRELEQGAKDMRRELASTARERDRLAEEVEELRTRLDSIPLDEYQRTGAEAAALREEVEQLRSKLDKARTEAAELAQTQANNEELEQVRASLLARYEVLQEGFISLRANLKLLDTYSRDIRGSLDPILALDKADLPEPVTDALEQAEVDLAVESFAALVSVLEDEADQVKSSMINLRASVEN